MTSTSSRAASPAPSSPPANAQLQINTSTQTDDENMESAAASFQRSSAPSPSPTLSSPPPPSFPTPTTTRPSILSDLEPSPSVYAPRPEPLKSSTTSPRSTSPVGVGPTRPGSPVRLVDEDESLIPEMPSSPVLAHSVPVPVPVGARVAVPSMNPDVDTDMDTDTYILNPNTPNPITDTPNNTNIRFLHKYRHYGYHPPYGHGFFFPDNNHEDLRGYTLTALTAPTNIPIAPMGYWPPYGHGIWVPEEGEVSVSVGRWEYRYTSRLAVVRSDVSSREREPGDGTGGAETALATEGEGTEGDEGVEGERRNSYLFQGPYGRGY